MEKVVDHPKDYECTNYILTDQLVKDIGVWALDPVHELPAKSPLCARLYSEYTAHGFEYAPETLSIPISKGVMWNRRDGKNYLTTIISKPEERAEREKVFAEKMAPLINNYEKLWDDDKQKLVELFRPFKEVDIKKASNIELKLLFYQMKEAWRICWEIHFYWMYFGAAFFRLGLQILDQLFGMDYHHPTFKKLTSGYMGILDKLNDDMWTLAAKAREMGLADIFLSTEDGEATLAKLEQSEAGRKWLEEFKKFINTHGWQCQNMNDSATPSWIEKPSLVMPSIVGIISAETTLRREEEFTHRVKEREEAKREILAKIPIDQRDWLEKCLDIARFFSFWSEDHTYYCEFPQHSTLRKLLKEIGERMAEAGAIDDPSDVNFLMPDDLLMGIIPMKNINLRWLVKVNREEHQRCLEAAPVFIEGDPALLETQLNLDPVCSLATRGPVTSTDVVADMRGAVSSPGVVEGIARVLTSESQIPQVRNGDILVTTNTSAVWTSVFSMIKGLVTDGGGELSHSAILAREYGIPAVVGTREATRRIKTGDRIKIDGDFNAVYILK